ncbi:unnamed protein product [Meloidogyne enterolobii]|uniref:Uncharacterized protein n=1 Tax=Meloidogyne enterolobii TaxID=390850 RepID=A0ACB1A131_MELEN
MFVIGGLCLLLWLAVVNANNSSEVQVGSGNYTLKDGKVTLSDEFRIYNARPNSSSVPEHLYPGCSIQIYKDFIFLKYNETSKEVCTVDLLTDRDDIVFTTSLGLCNDKKIEEDLKGPNILPFAYSLNNKEVNEIKNGPLYGKSETCPNNGTCTGWSKLEGWNGIDGPDCMPWTALEVEWRCKNVLTAKVYFLGDSGYITTLSIENYTIAVHFTVKVDKDGKVNSGALSTFREDGKPVSARDEVYNDPKNFNCINFGSIIKPKAWEIEGNVKKEIKRKKLMTFHLLPRSASRERGELGLTGKLPDFTPNHCRNMSIAFVSKVVEANSSTTTTTAQPSTNSSATNETISQEPTGSTTPNATIPSSKSDPPTKPMTVNTSSTEPPTNSSSPPPSVNTTSKPEQNNETLPQSSNGTVGTSPSMNYSTLTQNYTSTISVNDTNGTFNDNLTTSTTFSTLIPTIIQPLKTTTSTKLPSITNGTTKGIKATPKEVFPPYYYYIVGGGGAVVILLLVIICVCSIVRKNKKKASNEDESSEGSGGTTEELLSMEAKNMSGTQLETQGSHVSLKKSVVDKKEVELSKKEEISKKEVDKENMKKTLSKDVVGGGGAVGGAVVPNTIESKEFTGEQTTEEEVVVKPPTTPKATDPQVSTFSAPYEVDRKRLIVPMKEKGDPSTESKKSIESIVSAEKKEESKAELTVSSDEVVGNKEEEGGDNNKKKEESDDKKEEEGDDNNKKKEEGGGEGDNKEADVYD